MRILHLIDHLGPGGAQSVLLDMLACWPEPKDQIQVVGVGRGETLRGPLERLPNVEVAILKNRRWDLSGLLGLPDRLALDRWDIVHAHLNKSILLSLAAVRPFPARRVVHLHGDPARERLLSALLARFGHRADLLIGVSSRTTASAKRVRRGLGDKLITIPNGLDAGRLDVRSGAAAIRNRVRRETDGGQFVLGFVGRLDPAKGVGYLLRTVARLGPRVSAVLVGDGSQRQALEREARRLRIEDRTQFVGFQQHVAPWLASVDCLVLPSLTEGLPMTVLESFAVGTPVIASRVGGVEELVRHGVTGLCVAPRDVQALCDAVETLRQSPSLCRRLVTAAHRQVHGANSAERMARDVRDAYLLQIPPCLAAPCLAGRHDTAHGVAGGPR